MQTVFKICKQLIIKDPFYGLFLMRLNKFFNDKIPTAAVTIDGINPVLMINKEWWYTLDDTMKLGVLKHEIGHILYGHLTQNWDYLRKANPQLANISFDCEVNSTIPELQKDPYCYPAKWNLENNKGSLFYYDYFYKEYPPQDGGYTLGDLIDDHSKWNSDKMSDAQKQLIQQQIDSIAKNTAEQVQKSCGKIPGQFADYIDSLFKKKPAKFNWKQHFRRLVGGTITSEIYLTKMRPNKRFPEARGFKHVRKPEILVAVDTSGSISSRDLEDFFTEIHHMFKSGYKITVAEIDTQITNVFQYDGKQDIKAVGRGGTELSPAIEYYKQHKEFTTCVLFTDGYCNTNLPDCRNLLWVITSDGDKNAHYSPGKTIFIPSWN